MPVLGIFVVLLNPQIMLLFDFELIILTLKNQFCEILRKKCNISYLLLGGKLTLAGQNL